MKCGEPDHSWRATHTLSYSSTRVEIHPHHPNHSPPDSANDSAWLTLEGEQKFKNLTSSALGFHPLNHHKQNCHTLRNNNLVCALSRLHGGLGVFKLVKGREPHLPPSSRAKGSCVVDATARSLLTCSKCVAFLPGDPLKPQKGALKTRHAHVLLVFGGKQKGNNKETNFRCVTVSFSLRF